MISIARLPFRFVLLLILGSVVLLQGCASAKLANQAALTAAADAKASELGTNSELALQRAEAAYQTAIKDQLGFYAPHTMEKLDEALKQAQQAHGKQQTLQAVKAAAHVLTLLENGQRNKAEALKLLAPVFEQKQRVDELNAQTVLSDDYQNQLENIQELIGLIEEGKSEQAVSDSADVVADLVALERQTMLALHWQPAEDVLEQAEDEDADDHASKTYEDAEQKVKTAQEFISINFTKRDESKQLGLDALRASQRALFIGRESQTLQKLDAEKAEQAALKEEERLRQIGIAIGVNDLRYMALADQSNAIIEHIQTLRREAPTPANQPMLNEAQPQVAEQAPVNESEDASAGASATSDIEAAVETVARSEPNPEPNPALINENGEQAAEVSQVVATEDTAPATDAQLNDATPLLSDSDEVQTEVTGAETAEATPAETIAAESETAPAEEAVVEPVVVETAAAETVEAETVEAETVEAETVEAETVEAETVEAETVEAETVEAETAELAQP